MSSISPTSTSSSSTPASNAVTTQSNPGSAIISSAGLGSGLDINAIVSAIVQSEGQGQSAEYNQQTSLINSQIAGYSSLTAAAASVQTAIESLTTSASFNNYTATVGAAAVASATTSANAVPGSYTLAITQLAQGTNLQSAAFSGGSSATVGTGTLKIAVGSSSFSVSVTSSNNTLSGIASAINAASDNPGISATVITADTGSYLALSSSVTGASNAVTVSETDAGTGLSRLTYNPASQSNGLTQTQAAQNSVIAINGLTYTSASNAISTAISGVTINATALTTSSGPTTLTVSANPSGPTSAINSFVSAYNGLIGILNPLQSYDVTTGTSGALFGSSLTNSFSTQLTKLISGGTPSTSSTSSSALTSLAQIGITVNLDGTLAVNSSTLSTALQTNPTAVSNLFTNATTGVAPGLDKLLITFTAPGGLIDQQVTALQGSLNNISTQQKSLNDYLAQLQSSLFSEYNAMDSMVAKLKSEQAQLTAQLAALTTNYGPVSKSG